MTAGNDICVPNSLDFIFCFIPYHFISLTFLFSPPLDSFLVHDYDAHLVYNINYGLQSLSSVFPYYFYEMVAEW